VFQEHTAVFIVRVWLEGRELDAPPLWRATVEHVASGERSSFSDLDAAVRFIEARLGQLGIAPVRRGARWRAALRRRLAPLRRRRGRRSHEARS
jgi:hypothetical protein